MIVDQSSQAHYPAERDRDGGLDPLDDKDRHAVHALFEPMHRACQELEGPQSIVLDCAHPQPLPRAPAGDRRRG
ncbi:DUF3732 domain-containing protein [Alsobacter sp. SYSU BS001988]